MIVFLFLLVSEEEKKVIITLIASHLSVLLGSLLIKFIQELSVEYNKYLVGEKIPPTQHECFCLPKLPAGQCNICRSHSTEVVYK